MDIKIILFIIVLAGVAVWATAGYVKKKNAEAAAEVSTDFYSFSIPALDGDSTIQMADYKGKHLLLVNVASKCGYTPQYEGLQELYEKYNDQLTIIGFPCNQFMGQEPGGAEDIRSFCKLNYGVTFPLTEKIKVKGPDKHPIYHWLTTESLNGVGDYSVSWNFNKFLIGPDGKLKAYFGSNTKPMDEEITSLLK
jgi:glutathione peroxidase